MVAKIVFNTDNLNNDVFKILSEANTTEVFHNPDFKINPKIYKKYLDTLNHYIDNPNVYLELYDPNQTSEKRYRYNLDSIYLKVNDFNRMILL